MRRLLKKVKKTHDDTIGSVEVLERGQENLSNNFNSISDLSIKERLFANYGEALERIVLLLPMFSGAWLSSGFVLGRIFELALVSIPLIVNFLFQGRNNKGELFLEKEISIFVRSLPYLSALYLYSEYQRPDLSICLILSGVFLEGYLWENRKSSLQIFVNAISIALFMAATSQMGVLSQQEFQGLSDIFIWYFLLGFIPGTVMTARKLLLYSDKLVSYGWRLGMKGVGEPDENGVFLKQRPTAYTKFVLLFIILGPAMPALLLPFNILPKAFISASLIFFIVPKIAEQIQHTEDVMVLKELSLKLVVLTFGLEILVFLSAIVGI